MIQAWSQANAFLKFSADRLWFQVIACSESFTSERDVSKRSHESFAFGLGQIYILMVGITQMRETSGREEGIKRNFGWDDGIRKPHWITS